MSLFGHVLVLGGIRDTRTLEAFSVMCGEWFNREQTTRHRWLTPGEVYGLGDGQGLYFWGTSWGLIALAPHFAHQRWRAALAAAPGRVLVWDPPAPVRQAHPASARRLAVVPDSGEGDASGVAAEPELEPERRRRRAGRGLGGVA